MADPTWQEIEDNWGGVVLSSKDFAPVVIIGSDFFILGSGLDNALDAFVERKAVLSIPGKEILGTAIWPEIVGPSGEIVRISLGGHQTPNGAIEWEGPYDFVIDEDEFVDFAVPGRYLAVRFESTGIPVWTLQSYKIDYEILGNH